MTAATTRTARILVTGATGSVGRALVTELSRSGADFAVMSRRSESVAEFRSRGVAAKLGDLSDAAALRETFAGHQVLFLLPPVGPAEADQLRRDRAAIEAAAAAGVEHVVKVSASDASPDSPIPWARDHARSDALLAESGLAWTRLSPAAFTTNLLGMAPLIRRGLLPNPSQHGATAWIDPRDVAAAAHRVLTDDSTRGGAGSDGRSYLLTGTQPLAFPQIATVMSDELGRRVRTVPVAGPALYLGMRAGGSPHWEAKGMIAQFRRVVRRGLDGVRVHSTDLAELLEREPIDMAAFVRDHAGAFGRT